MRPYRTAIIAFALTAMVALASGARSQTLLQGRALAQAIEAAQAGDRAGAEAAAAQSRSAVVSDVVLWLRLRDGLGSWSEFRDFLDRNPTWPNLATVRRHAERAMPAGLPADVVLDFFAGAPPATGAGALRYAEALAAVGREPAARAAVQRAWRAFSMSRDERRAILARHEAAVAPYHVERIDMLLWRGLTTEAAGMLPLVPDDWRALAEARIAVREDADGSTAAIRAVPRSLRDDPGLAFERYLYRIEKGRWDEAEAFLLERSTSAEALGRPDMWMERRANLAREALRRGDAATAYALAAHNFGNADSGPDYADAEWVAGYVALAWLDQPAQAAAHFARFRDAVYTPISLGRAGYWLGLAHERAGDAAAATAAWQAGARHQTSFYGQLAAEKIGMAPDPRIAGSDDAPAWRGAPFLETSVVRAGRLLVLAGAETYAAQFLRHAAEDLPAADRAALAQMAIDVGRPNLGLRIAKDAARDGVVLPGQYYPLHAMSRRDWPIPTELALAIARQESEFDPRAVSPAGARGLMQLMPATAEEVSGKLGVAYEVDALTADPMYNAQLGTAYLARMLRSYDGSYVLAAAAYNAGPGRVNAWIGGFGDPRNPEVDTIRWIESIPFEETRNYVMRVLESLHVYRARLAGQVAPFRLATDIEGAS